LHLPTRVGSGRLLHRRPANNSRNGPLRDRAASQRRRVGEILQWDRFQRVDHSRRRTSVRAGPVGDGCAVRYRPTTYSGAPESACSAGWDSLTLMWASIPIGWDVPLERPLGNIISKRNTTLIQNRNSSIKAIQ